MRRTITHRILFSRILITVTTAVALTVTHALPALAADGGGGSQIAKGSVQGIVLAFVLGVLIGVGLTIHAYRGTRLGEAPGHHEHADDLRQGADYDPDMVETEREVPSGTA